MMMMMIWLETIELQLDCRCLLICSVHLIFDDHLFGNGSSVYPPLIMGIECGYDYYSWQLSFNSICFSLEKYSFLQMKSIVCIPFLHIRTLDESIIWNDSKWRWKIEGAEYSQWNVVDARCLKTLASVCQFSLPLVRLPIFAIDARSFVSLLFLRNLVAILTFPFSIGHALLK